MNPPPSTRQSAFTLIELLTVISIIAVLAGVLLSVTSRVTGNADRTTCLSNLHQIGIASLAFQSDNNGLMPGPCDSGQKIYYTSNMMCGVLAPYIGLPTTANNQIVPIFRCPAWKKVATQPTKYSDNIICYVTDNAITLVNSTKAIQVNGYPSSPSPTPPSRVALIASLEGQTIKANTCSAATPIFSMTNTMYITDCDQINWAFDKSAGWYAALPAKPVHGSVRNTLFFDMHADARPATLIP